jgi:hypothetical protein
MWTPAEKRADADAFLRNDDRHLFILLSHLPEVAAVALNHEEPDRVPLFFGTSGVTSILGAGYGKLKTHLGIKGGPPQWIAKQFQYVWPDEEVMERLGSDGRPVRPGPPLSSLAREVSGTELVDAWGCRWVRREGVPYYEVTDPPLRTATIADLEIAHDARGLMLAVCDGRRDLAVQSFDAQVRALTPTSRPFWRFW